MQAQTLAPPEGHLGPFGGDFGGDQHAEGRSLGWDLGG